MWIIPPFRRLSGSDLRLATCLMLPIIPLLRAADAPGGDHPIKMSPVEVNAGGANDHFDETGMGTNEAQIEDEPFSNDLVASGAYDDDPATAELEHEVTAIMTPNPVDLATGDSRLSLRGFPNPRLRDGFSQIGVPEILNVGKTLIIQGALIPVLGRAAPGGIQNFVTNRPEARPRRRFGATASGGAGVEQYEVTAEVTGPIIPKKFYQRIAFDHRLSHGPQEFARERYSAFSSALTWRHSRTASTLVAVDLMELSAKAAPAIPNYRVNGTCKIVGPYLPLADFNVYGPDAGVVRRTASVNVQFDGEPSPGWSLRAATQAWERRIEQDRFTTGVLRLDTGLFEGTREPQHLEQPQSVLAAQLEATRRFAGLGAEHKLMVSLETTLSDYRPEQRGLPLAARAALPSSVRQFNPWAADYSRSPYDPLVYCRIITDRREETRYSGLEVSERAAFARGRLVVTAGLRQDWVTLNLTDRNPGTIRPRVHDRVSQLSHLVGLNYQAVPSRLLLFADTSTAFEPSTRVDARTGRIQGNETTLGYETGVKGRCFQQRLDVSATAFAYFNRNISRRNPLYDDPVADANQTQPQLVAAGEERFTGVKLDARLRLSPRWSASLRAVHTRAITTVSPDLPEEVGRPLTRMPAATVSASGRYAIDRGPWKGISLVGAFNYIGPYVANYEDAVREELDYPGYGLVEFSLGYTWKQNKVVHGLTLGVRNAFNHDLLATQARVGAGRAVSLYYRLTF